MARESRLAMTADEVRAFLSRKDRLFVATLDENNNVPVGDVVTFVMFDGALVFEVPRDGHTYQNIQRDDRIACCAEQNPDYFGIAAVIVHGQAREVTAPEELATLGPALRALATRRLPRQDVEQSPMAVVSVPLGQDVLSFDFAKIADRARGVNH